MDNIKTYLNQIIDNQTTLASETLEKILKERVKQRFSDAKDSVKKKISESHLNQVQGYRVVSDSTGRFPIGEVHPVDFVKSMMNYGWTPYQQEGKNLILRKQNPQKNGGKKESFLELALT